ncbi:cell cycle control protein 50A-like isoform X2 [Pectinophora gossypiella]|uniref:cell cycle control protein 50A-like isoform X2 n=1 Tax=Pectinophora gossypiella TaxID=13191 RepID=UPI00214E7062|nr:cell cycle control protein 50A-like isoform X2 [Pectinophora gossypiella]
MCTWIKNTAFTEYCRKISKQWFLIWLVVAGLLVVVGIILVCEVPSNNNNEVTKQSFKYENIESISYTNCTDDNDRVCHEYIEHTNDTCTCIEYFGITKDWEGDLVVLYELPDFNQSSIAKEQNYFSSRDDLQLNGVLSPNVSEACEPYAYNEGKPIAPCGAIADAMFTDEYSITCGKNPLPMLYTGLLLDSEKEGFRNPPPKDDLQTAFQNFSKPKNWTKNIWELQSTNKGFETERFIAWMRTDLARKPIWRLDRSKEPYTKGLTGLKGSECRIRIRYNYPYSRYAGERIVIVAQRVTVNETQKLEEKTNSSNSNLTSGIILIIIGVLFGACGWLLKRKGNDKCRSMNL